MKTHLASASGARQFLLGLVLAAIFTVATSAHASMLIIDPKDQPSPDVMMLVDETRTWDLRVDLTEPAQGGRFFITWDPDFLRDVVWNGFTDCPAAPMSGGPFWCDGGGLDIANALIDETNGMIDVQVSAGFDTFSGLWDIGSFDLTAWAATSSLTPPWTHIGLDDSAVPPTSRWGVNGVPLDIEFIGNDVQGVVPLPAAVYLFTAALASLGFIRRRKLSKLNLRA
jgi:hypothetical protein